MKAEHLGDNIWASVENEDLHLTHGKPKPNEPPAEIIILDLVVLSNLFAYLRRWNQEATFLEVLDLYKEQEEKKDA